MPLALHHRFRALPLVALAFFPAVTRAAVSQSVPAPDLKPGDTWVFDRSIELGTSGFVNRRLDFRVERVSPDKMVLGLKQDGAPTDFQDHAVGRDWSQRRIFDGKETVVGQPFSFPMTVGKTWTIDYVDPTQHGRQTSVEHHETYKVVGWEDVTTPAGTFHALRIDSDDKIKAHLTAASAAVGGVVATPAGSTTVTHTGQSGPTVVYGEDMSSFYYAPEAKYFVKTTEEDFNSDEVRVRRVTDVLVSFKAAG